MGTAISTIRVPTGLYLQTRFFSRTAPIWELLGNLETRVLQEQLEGIQIVRPVYVSGLARSGTTIITEILNRHKALTSHRYSDFPPIYTPFWRNWLRRHSRIFKARPVERAHRDRIMMTADSPEAVEEVLWMHFFPQLHDARKTMLLDADTDNPRFEAFYREHIQKLLLVRQRSRYLAKGNYNLTRLEYLLRLFPDARFLVPIRNPADHIASLMKQQRLFDDASTHDYRVGFQLAASGHFEFGPQRRCIHFGDAAEVRRIEACWRDGREVEGWARYWNGIHASLADRLSRNPALSRSVLIVRYEDLCGKSQTTLSSILDHCSLELDSFVPVMERYIDQLTLPDYYQSGFSAVERALISRFTSETARSFGYSMEKN